MALHRHISKSGRKLAARNLRGALGHDATFLCDFLPVDLLSVLVVASLQLVSVRTDSAAVGVVDAAEEELLVG